MLIQAVATTYYRVQSLFLLSHRSFTIGLKRSLFQFMDYPESVIVTLSGRPPTDSEYHKTAVRSSSLGILAKMDHL